MADAKPKPNSIPKGSRPLWGVLTVVATGAADVYQRSADKVAALEQGKPAAIATARARALAAEVEAGDHDAYLSELLELEYGHSRREVVISALQARHSKLSITAPADPRKG